LSMCASSIPGRCADHEPPGRLSAIASGRAGHATACYRLPFASSGSPSADVPFGSLNLAPQSPCPASSRRRPANGFPPAAHHQPQRRPGKSIAANAAPPRSVQPSFCGGFAPQKLLLRLLSVGPCSRLRAYDLRSVSNCSVGVPVLRGFLPMVSSERLPWP